MKKRTIFTLLAAFCMQLAAWSQTIPTINPQFTYTDDEGQEQTTTSASESAPLVATFTSGTENADGWEAHYEWHFYKDGKRSEPYLIRYDETTDYTFTQAGTHSVELYAIFTQGTDTVAYTEEYWTSEGSPLSISISESKLNMPNAFSPNGDGINDIYKAKEGYQSIVECLHLQPLGTETLRMDRPCRRMGRQIQRQGCGARRVLLSGESQGRRRQKIRHQNGCESA